MEIINSAQDIWQQLLQLCKPQLSQDTYELWLQPVQPVSYADNLLVLEVPNKFFVDYLKNNLQIQIKELLLQLTGGIVDVQYSINSKIHSPSPERNSPQNLIISKNQELSYIPQYFNPKYSFESFVVGPSNRFAQAAAEAVAKDPGKTFNPLFIYGGVGLGKTHLMHAIANYTANVKPKNKVLYVSSERFINEFIDSLKYDKPRDFRNKYRNLDCLLIDDIQFLMGKGRSEEEFFYTFNTLFDSHKQIVISSDRPPKEISSLEERLISRFEWGVVADIQPPDLETRIAILRKKAEAETLYIPEDVILFLANQVKSNIRELEGSLIRVVAFANLTNSPLTVDSARDIIKDIIIKEEESVFINIKTIQEFVADHFNLDTKELSSKSRTDSVAFPRHIAMYLARTLTNMSTSEIGESFGGRDHATVTHACNKMKSKLAADPYFVALINKIIQKIKSGKLTN